MADYKSLCEFLDKSGGNKIKFLPSPTKEASEPYRWHLVFFMSTRMSVILCYQKNNYDLVARPQQKINI